MSPLARMMAIADIFEALTAIDRPYKKGKTLSKRWPSCPVYLDATGAAHRSANVPDLP
jgi:hypothetical protein